MEPRFYESDAHKYSFERKIREWNCENDPERYAALYILLADPNIREYQNFILLDDLKIIDADTSYTDNWITSADRDLMNVAMSVYNGGQNTFSVYNLMNDYSRFAMEGLRIFLEMNGYETD